MMKLINHILLLAFAIFYQGCFHLEGGSGKAKLISADNPSDRITSSISFIQFGVSARYFDGILGLNVNSFDEYYSEWKRIDNPTRILSSTGKSWGADLGLPFGKEKRHNFYMNLKSVQLHIKRGFLKPSSDSLPNEVSGSHIKGSGLSVGLGYSWQGSYTRKKTTIGECIGGDFKALLICPILVPIYNIVPWKKNYYWFKLEGNYRKINFYNSNVPSYLGTARDSMESQYYLIGFAFDVF